MHFTCFSPYPNKCTAAHTHTNTDIVPTLELDVTNLRQYQIYAHVQRCVYAYLYSMYELQLSGLQLYFAVALNLTASFSLFAFPFLYFDMEIHTHIYIGGYKKETWNLWKLAQQIDSFTSECSIVCILAKRPRKMLPSSTNSTWCRHSMCSVQDNEKTVPLLPANCGPNIHWRE